MPPRRDPHPESLPKCKVTPCPNPNSCKRKAESGGQDPSKPDSSKRTQTDYMTTINALVGPESVVFPVHKGIVCGKSKFFAAACGEGSRWREATENAVRVQDVSTETFTLYIHWVYTGNVDFDVIGSEWNIISKDSKASTQQRVSVSMALISLYLAADVLMDQKLKHYIIDEMATGADNGTSMPKAAMLEEIWSKTVETDELRRFVVDLYAGLGDTALFARHAHKFPHQFVVDLTVRLFEWKGKTTSQMQGLSPSFERRGLYY